MYNTAGLAATSSTLAATGLATGHYIVAALALVAAGAAISRLSFVTRRAARNVA